MQAGQTPPSGTITIAATLSSQYGANAGLIVHPQGHRVVSGSTHSSGSALDLWSLDPPTHLQRHEERAGIVPAVPTALLPPQAGAPQAGVLPVVDVASSRVGTFSQRRSASPYACIDSTTMIPG